MKLSLGGIEMMRNIKFSLANGEQRSARLAVGITADQKTVPCMGGLNLKKIRVFVPKEFIVPRGF